MFPIVSIVSPSYNQAEFLDSTIRSVVTQKGDFWLDYIVRDGASTDGSVAILEHWDSALQEGVEINSCGGLSWRIPVAERSLIRCRGLSFRWHSGRDSGQSQAINDGFEMAAGDLAGWLNSDDVLMPSAVQCALEAYISLRRVVFGIAQAVNELGEIKWTQNYWKRSFSYYDSYYRDYTPPQPSVFFSLKLFRKVGGLNESLHYMLDVDLWQRMLLAGGSFSYVPQIWSQQTYHSASKSMSGGVLFEKFKNEKKHVWEKRKREVGFRAYIWAGLRWTEIAMQSSIDVLKKLRRRILGFSSKAA